MIRIVIAGVGLDQNVLWKYCKVMTHLNFNIPCFKFNIIPRSDNYVEFYVKYPTIEYYFEANTPPLQILAARSKL
jgi:hypothetical protein